METCNGVDVNGRKQIIELKTPGGPIRLSLRCRVIDTMPVPESSPLLAFLRQCALAQQYQIQGKLGEAVPQLRSVLLSHLMREEDYM